MVHVPLDTLAIHGNVFNESNRATHVLPQSDVVIAVVWFSFYFHEFHEFATHFHCAAVVRSTKQLVGTFISLVMLRTHTKMG